jgi:hypothetical protein
MRIFHLLRAKKSGAERGKCRLSESEKKGVIQTPFA